MPVELTKRDDFALLRLNRPEALNGSLYRPRRRTEAIDGLSTEVATFQRGEPVAARRFRSRIRERERVQRFRPVQDEEAHKSSLL